jgi:hypothetical protein
MTLAEIEHMNAGLIISWLWFKPISKKLIKQGGISVVSYNWIIVPK